MNINMNLTLDIMWTWQEYIQKINVIFRNVSVKISHKVAGNQYLYD